MGARNERLSVKVLKINHTWVAILIHEQILV